MRGPFVKTEGNAPIGLDRDRVSAAPVAGQRVKPKQGQCHVFRAVRRFQRRQNLSYLLHEIGPDSATLVLSYSRRKPLCLSLDHAVAYS